MPVGSRGPLWKCDRAFAVLHPLAPFPFLPSRSSLLTVHSRSYSLLTLDWPAAPGSRQVTLTASPANATVGLSFTAFSLDEDDVVEVYDGASVMEGLEVGAYSGRALQGIVVGSRTGESVPCMRRVLAVLLPLSCLS